MSKRKMVPFVNRHTGDVAIVTRKQAKRLSEDFSEVEFTTNDEGKRVMRIQLADAVVDVSENEPEGVDDGDGKPE